MKFNKQIIILILFSSMVFGSENKKLAQTGFQFLSISADARGGGMGDAMTTLFGNSSSLFFNPAGLSRQEQMIDFSFSSNDWIAGISHEAFSISLSPKNGQYGVLLQWGSGIWLALDFLDSLSILQLHFTTCKAFI